MRCGGFTQFGVGILPRVTDTRGETLQVSRCSAGDAREEYTLEQRELDVQRPWGGNGQHQALWRMEPGLEW